MDRVNSVQELIERTRHMPLEKMRFFINEDRREPKCFGIYHDDRLDRWIVYKNKADGSRAVRYSGPDEACAAQELWAKINSEIDLRRPATLTPEQRRREKRRSCLIAFAILIALFAMVAAFAVYALRAPNRGYYVVDGDLYYYQDSSWYYYDEGDWKTYDAPDGDWYDDHYYGASYPDFDDEAEAFEASDYYVEPSRHESSSSSDSGIFDSWDSSDTDWSSDW